MHLSRLQMPSAIQVMKNVDDWIKLMCVCCRSPTAAAVSPGLSSGSKQATAGALTALAASPSSRASLASKASLHT